MDHHLDGKRVVIIGGSSGIGLETAKQALAAGASVTVAGRSRDRLRQAAETLGASDRLRTVVADMADGASIQGLFAGESSVDHVFLPAGELRPDSADLLTGDIGGMQSVLNVRLLGVAHVVRAVKPLMKGGSITLMSGLYATRPAAGGALAAAAVAAVDGMTRALALDLAPVRVNAGDIFIGVNILDQRGYPDCRPEYLAAYERMANLATKAGVEGRHRLKIHAPLIELTKAQIIHRGLELGVDYSLTSTCYDPSLQGEACGECDACLLRLKGFVESGTRDPAPYQREAHAKA